MHIPREFYYSETQSSTGYTHTSTNVLSVNQLIAGKAYWISPVSQHVDKPKKIIFADWTSRAWLPEKISLVKQTLGHLIHSGFAVYIWRHGRVMPLDFSDLSMLDMKSIREGITPAFIDEIAMIAATHNKIPLQQIQVLDDYWLEHLLTAPQVAKQRGVSVNALLTLTADELDKIVQHFKMVTPSLEIIFEDAYSGQSKEIVNKWHQLFPDAVIKKGNYKIANILYYLTDGRSSGPNNEQINLFAQAHASQLNQIEILGRISVQTSISNIRNKYFKSMSFIGSRAFACRIDFKDRPNRLEEINLSKSNISLENIMQLFARSTIKKLNLDECDNLGGELLFDPENLVYLEEISLANLPKTNLSRNNLQRILNAPHLKRLNLSACQYLEAAFEFEVKSLARLQELDVSRSNISPENLQIILNRSKLTTLKLRDCVNLMDFIALESDCLTYLDTADLSSTLPLGFFSMVFLKQILRAPNLRVLNLAFADNLEQDLELESHHLLKLEEINLASTNISFVNLKRILAAPNLRKLNISCIQLDLDLISNRLALINDLDVSYNYISLHFLTNILTSSLRQLNLSFSKNTIRLPLVEKNSLLSLEIIHLQGSKIIPKDFFTMILDAAPNLAPAIRRYYQSVLDTTPCDVGGSLPVENDLPHDPLIMKNFIPPAINAPFQFKYIKTKHQGMIGDRLSQYLTLEQQQLYLIPTIKEGMCNALSHYFLIQGKALWDIFINRALAWDGQRENLDAELINHFNHIIEFIHTYQLKPQVQRRYLGDSLDDFLRTRTSRVLSNPWHAIAIKPESDKTWHVYDPNYINGCKTVASAFLLHTIHEAIGSLVSVEAKRGKDGTLIADPDQFIAHGGLLSLCTSKNMNTMQNALPLDYVYSKDALDGLLLRDTSGRPAWVLGIGQQGFIKTLTLTLKTQFEAMHVDASQQLTTSLEALTSAQRGELITQLVQINPTQQQRTIDTIRKSSNKLNYEQALNTWDKSAQPVSDAVSYYFQCLNSPYQKQLIELTSSEHVDGLRWQLQQQAYDLHRSVFYIDKPEDLICAAAWIKKYPDNTGVLCNGPGGALYDFLQINHHSPPLLLINYDRFNADDLVRFNGLLDKLPHADGTPLPQNTQIIGLINQNKPDCYQGADFYSRFNRTERCPLSSSQLDGLQLPQELEKNTPFEPERYVINLYHAPDWEERLLGRWALDGDVLQFQEGELIHALKTGHAIEIQNGLWDAPDFKRFWRLLQMDGVWHAGRKISVSKHVKLIRPEQDVYDWVDLSKNIHALYTGLLFNPQVHVLNPSCLSDFFARYELAGERLVKQSGKIAQRCGLTLEVNITRTLTDDAWAMLLDECKRQQVCLIGHVAPGIALPIGFNYQISPPAVDSVDTTVDRVMISTDVDTTIWELTHQGVYDVIDVSECSGADLWIRLDGRLNATSLRFEFSQSEGALKTSLANHHNVILRGYFSPELQDALVQVLLARAQQASSNQLILLSNDPNALNYALNRSIHSVTPEQKRACLAFDDAIINQLGAALESESLSQLNARCTFMKMYLSTISDEAWMGMMNLAGHTLALTTQINPETSAAETNAFMRARIEQVNVVLDNAPFVFLAGLTGVGKSTFVEKEYCQRNALYLTEARIDDWARDNTSGRKILFIDEANLSSRKWSEFEGLFNTPPSILINGVLHILSNQHKVIFAGNPVSYGDERQLAPFFQRHGNAVLFTPLPPAVIYERILKPVCADISFQSDVVYSHILAVYAFICGCSTTDILISPRELQMMALLTRTRAERHPEENIEDIVRHFSYELAKELIPKASRTVFDELFKPMRPSSAIKRSTNTFLVTPSRQALIEQLDDLLALRQWRRNAMSELNDAQKGGGLGGILIEGEPGIGKSELVIASLISNGYQEIHDYHQPVTIDKPFYRMPISMSVGEKEVLLIKAFNEGAVVIIDEMNSSPMMERLLNDLLMGKNPHNSQHIHRMPGFMIIGTQNPITMGGRRAASTALQRRVITTVLPEYTAGEMQHILVKKGVDEYDAHSMVTAYVKQRTYATINHLTPIPNFRNLMELAERYLLTAPTHQRLSKKRKAEFDSTQGMPSKLGLFKHALPEHSDETSYSAEKKPGPIQSQ